MADHLETIQRIYQAFGRGDVAGVLEPLSPSIAWDPWNDHSAQRAGHPLFAARQGREGAAEFLRLLAEQAQIHDFQVLDVFGSGRQVAGEILLDYTWKPSGSRLQDEELHLWTFDEQGRVARFRHYIDTAKHLRAFMAAAAERR
jgi:uncharacterized protein